MSQANKTPEPWFDGGPLPTIVSGEDLHMLLKTDVLESYGGLDTGGRLQIHTIIKDPLANIKEVKAILDESCRVLKEDFGQYRLFTVASDRRTYKYNKFLGFESALVCWLMDNGQMWEVMVRYF